jgi:hypothetical protein
VIDSSDDEDIVEVTKPAQLRGSTSASKKPTALPKPIATKKSQSDDEVIVLDTTIDIEEIDTATESESDEEPLGLKVVLKSPEKEEGPPSSGSSNTEKTRRDISSTNTASLSPMAAFRAERIKMEQERLARLKRRRPAPPPAEDDSEDEEEEIEERPSKRP